jgi:hypothetical protein
MASQMHTQAQLHELLHQALETELGGIAVCEEAIRSARNESLRAEWQRYLDQTHRHRTILLELMDEIGVDPSMPTPSRRAVAHLGRSLAQTIRMAREQDDIAVAERTAAECVVLAETKDHLNWTLIGRFARSCEGLQAQLLLAAYDAVEMEEDHHLYHTMGWARELWLDALGLPAVLPPPEEVRQVESAIGAARAEQNRDTLLKNRH